MRFEPNVRVNSSLNSNSLIIVKVMSYCNKDSLKIELHQLPNILSKILTENLNCNEFLFFHPYMYMYVKI